PPEPAAVPESVPDTEQGVAGEADELSEPTLFRKDKPLPEAPPIDSPAFQRWFGDSKVVDEKSKPLVVYHGTDTEFHVFEKAKLGKKGAPPSSLGFWFADDNDNYAAIHGDKVMSVYLSM